MAKVVGLALNASFNFCVAVLPSAVRVTSERTPSLSTMIASVGLAPALSAPTVSAMGLPSSGNGVGNGSRPFWSNRVTATEFSSRLRRKISGCPSPFQSATAICETPARQGNFLGAASVPSTCWRLTDICPLSGSATIKSGRSSPLTSAHKTPRWAVSVLASGKICSCPFLNAPERGSAGLRVNWETSARPVAWTMVTR